MRLKVSGQFVQYAFNLRIIGEAADVPCAQAMEKRMAERVG